MAKSTILIRQSLFHRPSRRHLSVSSTQRTSTSPQRKGLAAPAMAAAVRPFSEIPGPIALPMLRHSAHVLPRIGNFHHTVGLGLLEGLGDKYGSLVRLAKANRSRPVLYVFDPEMMREVYESYATEPPRFEKSPLSHHRTSVGSHYPAHSEETKVIWAAIRTLLHDGSLIKNYEKAFDDIAAEFTRRLGDMRHTDNALNEELETEIYRWAIETLGMMIFGIRLGCLDGSVHIPTAENRVTKAVQCRTRFWVTLLLLWAAVALTIRRPEKTSMDDDEPDLCSLSKRSLEELTPAERLVRTSRDIADRNFLVRSEGTLKTDSKTFNSALKAFDRHFSLTEHFLLEALDALNSGSLKPEQVLLDKLRPLGRRILPLAADILLAGVDPLAQTALSAFYHLSLHAARQQRAHDEVTWSVAARAAGAPSPDLPYVGACVREAMRLHPVTGGVVRRTYEDIVVGGYEVPAGVDIVLSHGVTSKSEKQWGRARAFVPERWRAERLDPLKASRAHPLASAPFGATCPASGIAGNILETLVMRVVDKYRLEWHGPAPSVVTGGVNRLQPPFYFVLQNAH